MLLLRVPSIDTGVVVGVHRWVVFTMMRINNLYEGVWGGIRGECPHRMVLSAMRDSVVVCWVKGVGDGRV